MLFHFELYPIEQIEPWTTPSRGNEKSLHWFGLTLGIYWLDVGEAELFRYSPALLGHWAHTYPEATIPPFVDYQIVRLWEDVIEMLPAVLGPIPDDLGAVLRPGGIWQDGMAWEQWSDEAFEWAKSQGSDAAWDLTDLAQRWWSERKLDTGYLSSCPRIWFWRAGDTVYIRWDNRGLTIDGFPAWSAEVGEVNMTVTAFIEEVRSFDERLIRAMAERVDAVWGHWSQPEIRIDKENLRKEHRERSTRLGNALAHSPYMTDWEEVRQALRQVEQYLSGTKP